MIRSSKKCEKNEKSALTKLKKVRSFVVVVVIRVVCCAFCCCIVGCVPAFAVSYIVLLHIVWLSYPLPHYRLCFTFDLEKKTTQAIESGNHEGARIYAQDAIREKNQSLNHLRMASRLDACCSRIETAVRMNQVSTGMKGVVKGMDKSLASMNIEQLSKVMDKFESQFEDLDVKVSCCLLVLVCLFCGTCANHINTSSHFVLVVGFFFFFRGLTHQYAINVTFLVCL